MGSLGGHFGFTLGFLQSDVRYIWEIVSFVAMFLD